MITGWPVASLDSLEVFPHSLYKFRQSLEQAGFLDKYHNRNHDTEHWKDDDFFIRVGTFRTPIPCEQLRATQKAMRTLLSTARPIAIDVMVANISIVLYTDPSLRERYVRKIIPLDEFLEDSSCLRRMYNSVLEQAKG